MEALFFSQTLRRWYFKDIVKESGLSRERANFYLKNLVRENIVERVKPRAKAPYYLANRDNPDFRFQKLIYGLKMLQESGLFKELSELPEVKSAILFGSFARGDWNLTSDVDIFVFGDTKGFDKTKLEQKLHKEIQLFEYNDTKKMHNQLDPNLIPNIIKGINIKNNLYPFEVRINV